MDCSEPTRGQVTWSVRVTCCSRSSASWDSTSCWVSSTCSLSVGESCTVRAARRRPVMRRRPMVETWYAILSFMLTVYIVLDGFDIGAGALQYAVGKTDAERRLVIRASGPL